ncbi:MAG: putative profilin I, partial [Streblomastix strix]
RVSNERFHSKMSLGDHRSAQLVSQGIRRCALLGLGDGAVWADAASGLKPPGETQAIAKLFTNPQSAFTSGIVIGGQKFLATRADTDMIAARAGKIGLFLVKSSKAIVVVIHDDKIQAGTASTLAGKAADYFKEIGY